jgi:hypothetical protein
MNQRGVALPSALLALAILSALMVAFAMLAGSEPTIASNHAQSARARAFAESGVERAIWALSTPTASGLTDPLPNPMPAAYAGGFTIVESRNGATLGGFRLTVAPGSKPTERNVTSVGFTPDDASPRAIRKIEVTLAKIKAFDPKCTICLGGESPPGTTSTLQVGGNASINGSDQTGNNPPAASYCGGQVPPAAIMTTGTVLTNGNPQIIAPPGGAAVMTDAPRSSFDSLTLTDDDMAVLKSIAMSRGTYYRGSQTWESPPPDGIVFVDTPSGNPLGQNSPSSDLITVDIHGNWSSTWKGWLIVAGSIDIMGDIKMRGLIYAQNDIVIHGNGNGGIRGAIVATNRRDTVASQVDSEDIGNGRLTFDCPAVRDGGGTIPLGWFVKPGTYREVSGS